MVHTMNYPKNVYRMTSIYFSYPTNKVTYTGEKVQDKKIINLCKPTRNNTLIISVIASLIINTTQKDKLYKP